MEGHGARATRLVPAELCSSTTIWEYSRLPRSTRRRSCSKAAYFITTCFQVQQRGGLRILIDVPSGTLDDVLTDRRHDSLWNGDYRNRRHYAAPPGFLSQRVKKRGAQAESMRHLQHPSVDQQLDVMDGYAIAYKTRLRDSGLRVSLPGDQTRPFGHRACPAVVCDPVDDQGSASDERLGPERVGS